MKIAALFDLDGVIVDSEGLYTIFWEGIDRLYPSGIENYAYAIKGTNLKSILQHYPTEEIRNDVLARLDRYEEEMEYQTYPGAMSFLESLREAGIPTAIVTSSADSKMEFLYKKLPSIRECVDVIVTGSMVTKSKPDPEGYLTAARLLGVSPENCIVFEDSMQGLEAGRRAGGKVVGLATTNSRERVEPMSDITVDALADLTVEELRKLFKSPSNKKC